MSILECAKLCNYLYSKKIYSKQHNNIIALRGTQSYNDVIIDLHFGKIKYNNIQFHFGFYNAALCLKRKLKLSKDKIYTLTGHSSGGAIMSILAYLLTEDGYNIENVITFGSPKFTNKSGAHILSLAVDATHYCDTNDVVCNLPPFDTQYGNVINIDSESNPFQAHSMISYLSFVKDDSI